MMGKIKAYRSISAQDIPSGVGTVYAQVYVDKYGVMHATKHAPYQVKLDVRVLNKMQESVE